MTNKTTTPSPLLVVGLDRKVRGDSWPLGKPRKYAIRAYCQRSNTAITSAEHSGTAVLDGNKVIGWKCPSCGRILQVCRNEGMADQHGSRDRWPRHYSQAPN